MTETPDTFLALMSAMENFDTDPNAETRKALSGARAAHAEDTP